MYHDTEDFLKILTFCCRKLIVIFHLVYLSPEIEYNQEVS